MNRKLVIALVLATMALGVAPVAEATHGGCGDTVDCTISHATCALKSVPRVIQACTGWHTPPPP